MSTYEISKSSFLSLKAEILRKREELAKAQADNDVKIKIIKKKTPLELKNKGVEARNEADKTEESEDLLKQSRSALEYKSRLYDKLSSGEVTEDDKRRFLVRFDKKKKSRVNDAPPSDDDDDVDKYPESEHETYNSDEDCDRNPNEKWVDYVDCLGRTRKCLQKDLKYLMIKDEELRKTMEERNGTTKSNSETVENSENETEITLDKYAPAEPEVSTDQSMSNDERLEILKRKWQEDEERLRDKNNIHYQDILFDEARTHGAGYYAFSVDEEERQKQQEALKKLREETEQKQKRAQELKAMREKQLAARIKAAKNRKRARMGLPPEEDEPEIPTEPKITDEEAKKLEEEKKQQELKEKMLDDARKRHVRPWDIGKEGIKEHYEMTQEEWMEKKRKERPQEFAPPSAYRKEFRSTVKIDVADEPSSSLRFTTKKNKIGQQRDLVENKKHESSISFVTNEHDNYNVPFGPSIKDYPQSDDNVSLPNPIVNLCEQDYEDRLLADYNSNRTESCANISDESHNYRGGVEIAPPPTYDYYGPNKGKRAKLSVPANNIEDSIEAGLKFLRHQVELKENSSKHPRETYLS